MKTEKSVLRDCGNFPNAYIRKGNYQSNDLSFYLMKLEKERNSVEMSRGTEIIEIKARMNKIKVSITGHRGRCLL